jgi:hypothetical protein
MLLAAPAPLFEFTNSVVLDADIAYEIICKTDEYNFQFFV